MLRYHILIQIRSDKVLILKISALLLFNFGNLTFVNLFDNFCVSLPYQSVTTVSSETETFTLPFPYFCMSPFGLTI